MDDIPREVIIQALRDSEAARVLKTSQLREIRIAMQKVVSAYKVYRLNPTDEHASDLANKLQMLLFKIEK